MTKIRRGNFIFVAWVEDHSPKHVHVYRDGRFVVMGPGEMAADEGSCRCPPQEALRGTGERRNALKITKIEANNRKKVFEVHTRHGVWAFPYSRTEPPASSADPVTDVYSDAELGKEAFTYVLRSGVEGTVHIESVLEYNREPSHMADLMLYELTTVARKRFDGSPLSAREVARLLETSPAQLYRLLDPTNYNKSARQLLTLLSVLGVEIKVSPSRRPGHRPLRPSAKIAR